MSNEPSCTSPKDKSVEEKRGTELFEKGKEALKRKGPDLSLAKKCFLDAAAAFGRAGSPKKQQLMLAMMKRMEDTSAAGSSNHSQPQQNETPASVRDHPNPAPPKEVKKKYSMDYSRFDQLDDSDEEVDSSPPLVANAQRFTPKFVQAMRYNEEVQKRGNKPEEIAKAEKMYEEAFKEASPDARDQIWEMFKAGGAVLPDSLKKKFLGGDLDALKSSLAMAQSSSGSVDDEPVDSDPKVIQAKLDALKKSMSEDLERVNSNVKSIKQQEEALSGLKNFDDLVVFMQKNGLSNQQVEAALEAQEAGNTEAVQKILADATAKNAGNGLEIDQKLNQIDRVATIIETGKDSSTRASEKGAAQHSDSGSSKPKAARSTKANSSGFSFYKDKGTTRTAAGVAKDGGGGQEDAGSDITKQRAELEARMEEAKHALKGFEDTSAARQKEACFVEQNQVERASRALEEAERAKEQASKDVDRAVESMEQEAENRDEEAGGAGGERRFLAEKEKDFGNKAFATGNFEESIEHFSRALKLAGPNCIYYTNRAAAYLRLSKPADALKDAERAISVDGRYVKALFRRAQALEALERYSDAVAAYEYGLTVMPDSDQLLQGLKSTKDKAEKASAAAIADRAPVAPDPCTSNANLPEYRFEEADENLIVHVELPGRENMQGVDLELFPESLSLSAPPFAALSLTLPFPVHYEEAKAKFVKKSRTLRITIPRV